MHTVFVTGGLASGKKTVCEILGRAGARVLDLDSIAKEEQEAPCVLEQLAEQFGDDIVDAAGFIDRRLLAERAFASPESAARLNAICWPPVVARLADIIVGGSCQMQDAADLLVVEVPLLAEAHGLRELADEVICVVADEGKRRERAIVRGMSPEDADNRLALQASDEERIAISDYVINNNDSLEALEEQVQGWLAERDAKLELGA